MCRSAKVVDKDNRILELLKGTTNAQSLAARQAQRFCGIRFLANATSTQLLAAGSSIMKT